jgi:hypothetical protein
MISTQKQFTKCPELTFFAWSHIDLYFVIFQAQFDFKYLCSFLTLVDVSLNKMC